MRQEVQVIWMEKKHNHHHTKVNNEVKFMSVNALNLMFVVAMSKKGKKRWRRKKTGRKFLGNELMMTEKMLSGDGDTQWVFSFR